jgi:hopanoid biosynthesis associated radical SAM protein HpnH
MRRSDGVSIPGGEPLMHPQIDKIVEGLVARKKYIYLCTNALLAQRKAPPFKPSKYLSFSVHMDGQKEHHDFSVCREGGFDIALEGHPRGDRSRIPRDHQYDSASMAPILTASGSFDEMMEVGVESMMVSPGYSYDKAPDQKHFMGRARTRRVFRAMMSNRKKTWRFNQSPLFLEYLMGKRTYNCTPWGMPTYNLFGWQKPCYLLQDGYAESYKELMETTEWDGYGTQSGNPQCANCMVHCGYEPSSVNDTFGSLRGFVDTVKATSRFTRIKMHSRTSNNRYVPCTPTIRWCRLALRPRRTLQSPKKAGHERPRSWTRTRSAAHCAVPGSVPRHR